MAYELPADADDATREALGFLYGGIIYAWPGGLFGLRPVAPGSDAFSEDRVGLDHLALAVGVASPTCRPPSRRSTRSARRTGRSRTSARSRSWSSATPTASRSS